MTAWEMAEQEDPGVSLSTRMTLQQAGAVRTPDRNSAASRREVNAEVGGFRGILAFCGMATSLQPPVQWRWGGRPEFLVWPAGAGVARRSQFHVGTVSLTCFPSL